MIDEMYQLLPEPVFSADNTGSYPITVCASGRYSNSYAAHYLKVRKMIAPTMAYYNPDSGTAGYWLWSL